MHLCKIDVKRTGADCPFENEEVHIHLGKGSCIWLQGSSGAGKTTLAHALLGLRKAQGFNISVDWENGSDESEPDIGILFQQGVLIDSLNLYENLVLSCQSSNRSFDYNQVVELLERVGLEENDLYKMPNELSGGMLRRASLLQVMVQKKSVIILDEPFVGLDEKTAQSIVDDLKRIMGLGFSFILISHQEFFAKQLAKEGQEVTLKAKASQSIKKEKPSLFHLPRYLFISRTLYYIRDYLGISLPLIILAFIASGLAVCLPFAELLVDFNVQGMIHKVESNLSPLIRWLVSSKIEELTAKYLPVINRAVYATAVFRAFVVELGPLLTALLLAGRIGGSYAGEVSMMEATNQNRLLQTLGQKQSTFSFYPALIAAVIAAPILTFVGTFIGLGMGTIVASVRSFQLFSSTSEFVHTVWEKLTEPTVWYKVPLFVNFYRSILFILIIMGTAQLLSRYWKKDLQPRDVPKVITWTVVVSCLVIIVADWALAELYIN